MTLTSKLTTISAITADRPLSSDMVVEIDAYLTSAGAALMSVSKKLEDIATSLMLQHECDISSTFEALEECQDTLKNGADAAPLHAAVDNDEIDAGSLPSMLCANFGPLTAFDPRACKAQLDLVSHTAKTLNTVARLITATKNLSSNDFERAAELLFAASEVSRTAPDGFSSDSVKQAA